MYVIRISCVEVMCVSCNGHFFEFEITEVD